MLPYPTLYFRLAEYIISVPPLRSRREDIAYLARRFLTQARETLSRPPADIAQGALDLLHSYSWPGNVRELRSVMRRVALTLSDIVMPEHLACSLSNGGAPAPTTSYFAYLQPTLRRYRNRNNCHQAG